MTETGLPNSSSGARLADTVLNTARSALSVRIDSMRGDIQNIPRPAKVEGEVSKVSPDGTVTIQTDEGEIDIRPQGRITLQEGQKVTVELPPNPSSTQVTIRPIVDEGKPTSPPVTPLPLPDDAPSQQPPARPVISPPQIPTEIRALLDQLSPELTKIIPEIKPQPLPLEAIVRLVPLPSLPPVESLLPQPLPVQNTVSQPPFSPAAFQTIQVVPLVIENLAPVPGPTPLLPSTDLLATPKPQQAPAIGILNPSIPSIPNPNTSPIPSTDGPALPSPIIPGLPTAGIIDSSPQPITPPSLGIPPQVQTGIPTTIPPILSETGMVSLTLPIIDAKVISIAPEHSVQIIPPNTTSIVQTKDLPHIADRNTPITLNARVIATTPQHMPIITIPGPELGVNVGPEFGVKKETLFMLQFPASNLPVGSEIQLLPQQVFAPAAAPAPANTAIPSPFSLMSGWTWPAFDDLIDIMPQIAPPQVAQAMNTMVPNPGNPAQMPNALLFMIAAIRSGDISGWVGDKALSILKRDGGVKGMDILSRITRDFSGLSNMADQTITQDWKAMAIPMLWQGEINKIHLYYRHQGEQKKDDQNENNEGKSTRFIFDLNLNHMGDIQLDGLMKGKRFDLILRSQTIFAHSMQTTMRSRYLEILEAGGLTGDLAFQTRADQWVRVEIRPQSFGVSA